MTDAPERLDLTCNEDGELGAFLTKGPRPKSWPMTPYLRADLVPSWQPIETAPAQTTVLLWEQENGGWLVGRLSAEGVWWSWGGSDASSVAHVKITPTHWMPLPEPPDA